MASTSNNAARNPAGRERLETSVQFVKGCGPERAALLDRLGLRTVEDLLFNLPRDYLDLTNIRPIPELKEGVLQTVRGEVVDVDARELRGGRSLVAVLIENAEGVLRGIWFNQPYMLQRFQAGQDVLFSGKPRHVGGRWEMNNPHMQWLEREEDVEQRAKVLPVYSLTDGLRMGDLRRMTRHALDEYADLVTEIFDEAFLHERHLLPIGRALRALHFPREPKEAEAGRRRLVYEDLFLLELALAVKRTELAERSAPMLEVTAKIDARIRRLFPFRPTAGQERAIADLSADLASGRPMNRLLQGDVGSGKTAVALYGVLAAVAHGYQAVLMTPTELLAHQHWQTVERYLPNSRVRRVLLTGGSRPARRAEILQSIRTGQLDLIVGTQAVIQQDVDFSNLGLVVIDEQHRFGVRQRAHFRRKNLEPHTLVMTATPIPRTLCLTVFGDLDLSVIPDLPPGRQKVRTYLVDPDDQQRPWSFVRAKLDEGNQVYVVCPLVQESQTADLRSAEETYAELQRGELAGYRIGLLHGRLDDRQKRKVMDAFRSGQTQVLVTTTVVEVGIDVPAATLMVVQHAERFGLSQLHQLRGRIGRGVRPGYCFLLSGATTEVAQKRLRVLTETSDGFRIAEADFELRGPGDVLGTRQHGLPSLRVADLLRDAAVLADARRDAFALVRADPGLSAPEHRKLRHALVSRYASALELARVG